MSDPTREQLARVAEAQFVSAMILAEGDDFGMTKFSVRPLLLARLEFLKTCMAAARVNFADLNNASQSDRDWASTLGLVELLRFMTMARTDHEGALQ